MLKKILYSFFGLGMAFSSMNAAPVSFFKESPNPNPVHMQLLTSTAIQGIGVAAGYGVLDNFIVGATGGVGSLNFKGIGAESKTLGGFATYYGNDSNYSSSFAKVYATRGEVDLDFGGQVLGSAPGEKNKRLSTDSYGFLVGYQKVFRNNVTLNFALGGKYMNLDDKTKIYKYLDDESGKISEFDADIIRGLLLDFEVGVGYIL